MKKTIAHFERVSFARFYEDSQQYMGRMEEAECRRLYEAIKLPKRATAGAGGYDFFLPFALRLDANQSVRIPSGIRCSMCEGWVLTLYPRSSLGCRYQLRLDNTVGVIDADYYGADNEGHILIQLTNGSCQTLSLAPGSAFVQGVFLPFGITDDDDAGTRRSGGFGSTDMIE